MSDTKQHNMTISNNPLLMAQVNVWIAYLSRTNQDKETKVLSEILRKDDRTSLWDFAKEQMEGNTNRQIADVSFAEIDGRRALAAQIVTILKLA